MPHGSIKTNTTLLHKYATNGDTAATEHNRASHDIPDGWKPASRDIPHATTTPIPTTNKQHTMLTTPCPSHADVSLVVMSMCLSLTLALSFFLARLLSVFINLSEPLPLHSPLFRVGPDFTIVGTPTTTCTPPTILIVGTQCVIPTAVTPGTRAPRVMVAQAAGLARHPRPIYKGGVAWHVVACHIMYVKFVQRVCCNPSHTLQYSSNSSSITTYLFLLFTRL